MIENCGFPYIVPLDFWEEWMKNSVDPPPPLPTPNLQKYGQFSCKIYLKNWSPLSRQRNRPTLVNFEALSKQWIYFFSLRNTICCRPVCVTSGGSYAQFFHPSGTMFIRVKLYRCTELPTMYATRRRKTRDSCFMHRWIEDVNFFSFQRVRSTDFTWGDALYVVSEHVIILPITILYPCVHICGNTNRPEIIASRPPRAEARKLSFFI